MNADPLWRYMEEREMIRLRRARGAPWPWTDDPVLRAYRFTNVKREHDRVTQDLLVIYRAHADDLPAVALYHCGLYRLFGTVGFAHEVGWLAAHDPAFIAAAHDRLLARGASPWTGAYVIPAGAPGEPKWRAVAERLAGLSAAAKVATDEMRVTGSWERGYEILHDLSGLGGTGFLVKEILQDYLLWLSEARAAGNLFAHRVNDAADWTPVGPGARRGLNRLVGRPPYATRPDRIFLAEVRALKEQLAPLWKEAFPAAEPLTAHDVQFSCCEFSKYVGAQEGARPKRRYASPVKEAS